MQYLLDTADVAAIRRLVEFYPLAGVTTNPTLVARAKRPFLELIEDIRAAIGPQAMLHVQVTATDAETMVKEAQRLGQIVGAGFHAKVPLTAEGLKAIRLMAGEGIPVTATAVITPQQALFAARAGASFVAPYVNRIDMIGGHGVGVVAAIAQLFSRFSLSTRLLTASFKTVRQVEAVALAGAHSATVAPELLEQIIHHPLTDAGIAGFSADWAEAYGVGRTVLDVLDD
jgi:fructose-6-phosphate aldolase 2